MVEDVPRGVHVNFLKAERSLHRWALGDLQRIHTAEEQASQEGGGVEMHVLEDAGHWVCFHVAISLIYCSITIIYQLNVIYKFFKLQWISIVIRSLFIDLGNSNLDSWKSKNAEITKISLVNIRTVH